MAPLAMYSSGWTSTSPTPIQIQVPGWNRPGDPKLFVENRNLITAIAFPYKLCHSPYPFPIGGLQIRSQKP
jgi:hypothetical protein